MCLAPPLASHAYVRSDAAPLVARCAGARRARRPVSDAPDAMCPLCGGPAPLRFRKSGYAIHRCAACDFEQVCPVPSRAEVAALYAQQYFTGAGCGYRDYFASERATNLEKAAVRLGRIAELGATRGGRLLDVGCADGVFVESA